jgi:competence protein ComEA
MFGSERPDGSAARARLQAVMPRWVPSEDDIRDATPATAQTGPHVAPADGPSARHALPGHARASWRLDGSTVRGLVSLGLAAAAGALIVVILGWPQGTDVPAAKVSPAADSRGQEAKGGGGLLVQPSTTAVADVVVVDVDGAVRRPGVVELPMGSRVVDALKSAGGAVARADTGALNLAQILIDGEQIVVPRQGSGQGSPSPGVPAPALSDGSTPASLINLNSASSAELESLPGIGPVLAAAIVEWRTQNGGFTSIDQLEQVSGIGPATFAEIAPLVRI